MHVGVQKIFRRLDIQVENRGAHQEIGNIQLEIQDRMKRSAIYLVKTRTKTRRSI
jgi:hypothetical protein